MSDTNKSEHLIKFEQSMASLDEAQKQLKACMDGDMPEKMDEASYAKMHEHMKNMHAGLMNAMSSLRESMHHAHNYIHDRIDKSNASINERMDNHEKNHVPKLLTPTHVENFLKAVKADNDYEVHKKPIFASSSYASKITASPKGIKVELDLNKPKNN